MDEQDKKLELESMEFDAIHGLGIDDPSQPLILYWNGERVFEEYRRALHKPFWLMVIMLGLYTALMILTDLVAHCGLFFAFLGLVSLFGFALAFGVSMLYMKHLFLKTRDAQLKLTADGLSFQMLYTRLSSVAWSNISEVRLHSHFGHRMLAINFSDIDAVDADDGTRGHLKICHLLRPWQRKLRLPESPDFLISETSLPIDVDELLNAINMRRTNLICD